MEVQNKLTICIDFDGTCVTHEFPAIGSYIGAEPVLRELVANGHNLILFTMRSDISNPKSEAGEIHLAGGNYLTEAVEWFKKREIPLYGIQKNPEQHTWTTSPKAYAHLYIDDAALGIPLVKGYDTRPYVDWRRVREMLVQNGIIEEKRIAEDLNIPIIHQP